MHEKIRSYIRAALHRRYPIEAIIGNLVSVGHDPVIVRRLAREVISERLQELEGPSIDPLSNANMARKIALELLVGIALRVMLGTALLLTLFPSIFHPINI